MAVSDRNGLSIVSDDATPGSISSPSGNAAAVTPSDSVNLSVPARSLWVGGAGAVSCLMKGGQTVVFSGVAAGTVLRLQVQRVNATGTTATNIVALW